MTPLINHLFAGGPAPVGGADANGDGSISVADIFYVINYLFAGGPAPLNPTASVFDAMTYYPGNQRYYEFHGALYSRQPHTSVYVDIGYPRAIWGGWSGFPSSWGAGHLDAIEYVEPHGKYYLFQGNQFSAQTHNGSSQGLFSITTGWSGWPASWGTGDVDAVVYNPGNNKFYLFKGSEYVRHSPGGYPDLGYPRSIADNWIGWPPSWGSGDVDTVVYYPPNGKFYLFKGNEYARHSFGQPMDPGYPQPIEGNWGVERRKTAVDLIGDINALKTTYSIQHWDGMDFPANYAGRGVGGHIQGAAKVGSTWIFSHSRDDDPGLLIWGTNNNWNFEVGKVDLGNHPGGIQASGNVVVVTYKRYGLSETTGIKFFEFDSSGFVKELVHLRLPSATLPSAGLGEAAGLAYHPVEKRYYVIDGRNATSGYSTHPMYRSRKIGAPLADPTNGWEFFADMYAYGSEGGMQLMYDDKTAAMYLIALSRPEGDDAFLQNTHRMDVTWLDLQNKTGTHVGYRSAFNRTDNLIVDPSFRWGAGLLLDDATGRISVIATERCTSYEYTFSNPTNHSPCEPTQDLVDYFILTR